MKIKTRLKKDFGHSVQFFPLSIKVATFRKTAVNSGSFILRYVAHVKLGYSEKDKKFEKIFHLKIDETQ